MTEEQRYRQQLTRYIQQTGKAANQRLRQLEGKTKKTTKSGAYEDFSRSSNAYNYAKRQAEKEQRRGTERVYGFTGAGEAKFLTTTKGLSLEQLEERAAAIRRFMEARTSTVGGVRNVLHESYERYLNPKDRQGNPLPAPENPMSEADYGAFFRSAVIQNFNERYRFYEIENLQEVASGMPIERIEATLKEYGFDEKTTEADLDKIPLGKIFEALKKGRERK